MQAAARAYDYNLINFYKETNDTLNYLIRAINYYDNYYMTVSVDSIKKMDSLKSKSLVGKQTTTTTKNEKTTSVRRVVKYAPITQSFTNELNRVAWNFYKMSSDTMYLNKALQWVKRGLEFYEPAEATDTYARLLYKTGKKEDAVFWELKTIALKQKMGYPTVEFEAVLNKMKAGAEIID